MFTKKTVASITKSFVKAVADLDVLIKETDDDSLSKETKIITLEEEIQANDQEVAQAKKVKANLEALLN